MAGAQRRPGGDHFLPFPLSTYEKSNHLCHTSDFAGLIGLTVRVRVSLESPRWSSIIYTAWDLPCLPLSPQGKGFCIMGLCAQWVLANTSGHRKADTALHPGEANIRKTGGDWGPCQAEVGSPRLGTRTLTQSPVVLRAVLRCAQGKAVEGKGGELSWGKWRAGAGGGGITRKGSETLSRGQRLEG